MNVKPGDLAIVIAAHPNYLDCVGRIVNVIEWVARESSWAIDFVGTRPASVPPHSICVGRDHTLRPVSGLDDPEQIDTEQPINSEVTA